MNIEIRKAIDSDTDGIRELFFESFWKELSYSEWAWKYKHSPWGSTEILALDGEKIVAHYGGIKSRFCFNGRMFDVFQPCDVMTHPKYRARFFSKKGAMVKAGEYFFSNNSMDFAFGFPSERHAILGTRQLGYTEHKYVSVLKKDINRHKYILKPFLKISTSWNLIDATEIDILWNSIKNENMLSIEKKSSYIFWRFRDHPIKHYEPLIIRGRFSNNLRAFCVFSISEDELSVLDFLCPKEFTITLFNLLENIVLDYKLRSLKLWLNTKEDIYPKIVKNGYNENSGVPLLFKIINKEIKPDFLFDNYQYRMGDYDAG